MCIDADNIKEVIDNVFKLAWKKMGGAQDGATIIKYYNSEGLHNFDYDSYKRVAFIFPVENIGIDSFEVSILLYVRIDDGYGSGGHKSKQYTYLPARANNLVNVSFGASVRRTDAQVANQIANFILTGEMEFKKE